MQSLVAFDSTMEMKSSPDLGSRIPAGVRTWSG